MSRPVFRLALGKLSALLAAFVCLPFYQAPLFAGTSHDALFPGNIDCAQFEKTGPTSWRLRDAKSIDLGNWDAAFVIQGTIKPGGFKSHGIDLYDVLEGKCDIKV